MSVQQTTEIRELSAHELDQVSGGTPYDATVGLAIGICIGVVGAALGAIGGAIWDWLFD